MRRWRIDRRAENPVTNVVCRVGSPPRPDVSFNSASTASMLCTFTATLACHAARSLIHERFPFDSAVTVPVSQNVQPFEVVPECPNSWFRTWTCQAMWGRLGPSPKQWPPRLTPHRASQYCDIRGALILNYPRRVILEPTYKTSRFQTIRANNAPGVF